jgi:hypothetical protein
MVGTLGTERAKLPFVSRIQRKIRHSWLERCESDIADSVGPAKSFLSALLRSLIRVVFLVLI